MLKTGLNNNHLLSQFPTLSNNVPTLSGYYTSINFIENVPLGREDSFGTNLKKILSRIFFRNVVPKNSFLLLHGMLSVFSTINLNLNSSTCERFIEEHWDNIWCNFMRLKKSVMGLEFSAFKNCNKWALVYKDYWRWKVYILNKCSYSNWKTIQQRLKYPHPFKK